MEDIKKVTGVEMRLLDIIFGKNAPITVPEIRKELRNQGIGWTHQAVSSFLTRLEKKEIIASTKEGKLRYFYPIITKDKIVNDEAKKVVDFHFQGSLSHFLSAFVKNNKLQSDEIRKIKEWAEHLDDE